MSILQKSRGLFQNITKTKVFKKTVMKTNLKKPPYMDTQELYRNTHQLFDRCREPQLL